MRHVYALIGILAAAVVGCGAGTIATPATPDAGGGGGLPDAAPGCVPQCTDGVCGDDGCGGVCHPCNGTDLCEGGTCVAVTDGIQVDVTGTPHTIHPEI